MSWEPDEPLADDEPLARPFLLDGQGGRRGGLPSSAGAAPAGEVQRPPAGGSATSPWPVTPPSRAPNQLFEPVHHDAPFATDARPYEPPPGVQHPDEHHGEIRPYVLTGGRTSAHGAAVAMETVLLATGARAVRGPAAAGLERERILRLAERPCSAAEVAARLLLPLQVALVLVTDLVAEGLLDATAVGASQADDVLLIERLIAGVAAL